MTKEYRIVSTLHAGYFVLFDDKEIAAERIKRANGSVNDVIGKNAKLQERPLGMQGNDSTWTDVQ